MIPRLFFRACLNRIIHAHTHTHIDPIGPKSTSSRGKKFFFFRMLVNWFDLKPSPSSLATQTSLNYVEVRMSFSHRKFFIRASLSAAAVVCFVRVGTAAVVFEVVVVVALLLLSQAMGPDKLAAAAATAATTWAGGGGGSGGFTAAAAGFCCCCCC